MVSRHNPLLSSSYQHEAFAGSHIENTTLCSVFEIIVIPKEGRGKSWKGRRCRTCHLCKSKTVILAIAIY